jgi:hypothetical protein
MVYRNDGRPIKMLDNIVLVVMVVFVSLLFMSGVEYISFTTGLLVGTTVIQVYFHRFSDPLPPDKSPEPPVTALKLMSYSIQANAEGVEKAGVHNLGLPLGSLHARNARMWSLRVEGGYIHAVFPFGHQPFSPCKPGGVHTVSAVHHPHG